MCVFGASFFGLDRVQSSSGCDIGRLACIGHVPGCCNYMNVCKDRLSVEKLNKFLYVLCH